MVENYAQQLLDDFEERDDLQNVSLTNAVDGTTVKNVRARCAKISFMLAQIASQTLALEPTDQLWMLGAASLDGVVPDRGDLITTANGTIWTILWLKAYSFGDTVVYWDCVGRKQ